MHTLLISQTVDTIIPFYNGETEAQRMAELMGGGEGLESLEVQPEPLSHDFCEGAAPPGAGRGSSGARTQDGSQGSGLGHNRGHHQTQAAESCCVRPRGCLLGRSLKAEREERSEDGQVVVCTPISRGSWPWLRACTNKANQAAGGLCAREDMSPTL